MKAKLFLALLSLGSLLACKKNVPSTAGKPATQIAVPNGGFENWDWQLRPLNWYTNGCPLCVGAQWDEYVVKKDSVTLYQGKYSAQLMYNYSFQAYAKIKFALTTHPTILQAYISCYLYKPDTVNINIKLFKNKIVVDSGYWQSTATISNFSQINVPLTNNATAIDTALITITGGKTVAPNNYNSSTLWVDNLSFFK
ncbi:MAG TPA: hypothetical protein VK835_00685 [Bacteroidia bacterium]|jgi:hypothetical protein|nr:hypothetical protein [Bacteroidia bacterium]